MTRETSIEVYNQIMDEGLLNQRCKEAYDILFNHGPLTANEVHHHSKLVTLEGYRHCYSSRIRELRLMKAVKVIGRKECDHTGREVMLFDVTPHIPQKLRKKLATEKKLRQAKEIERQKARTYFQSNQNPEALRQYESACAYTDLLARELGHFTPTNAFDDPQDDETEV